ncbi:LysR family transcriptional regulator [Bradyrhizobium sp. NBAIM20]|uniref:LysR family transcriptional regulator n=1 Tax=unclassified Bradyrhizobium TaxID=2631580 RepID=UPI001CD4C142|nr:MULTISPECIES: LysR family transcriptional regulator [unclassified Bradyrhizobium]MCA1410962.1 LysR family transcriptional regulator [Bradyrhizobium sp. NBAIM20]MCA1461787.1 LysR family transcriptional regulator [Bradyrhizobium sp. NBAIM18]
MDIYENFKTFQVVAQLGSFSRAALHLGIAASVVTKRINQLEHRLKVVLFKRSTRQLVLTEIGRRYVERSRLALVDFDDLLKDPGSAPGDVEDFLRVKAPTSLTTFLLRGVLDAYQRDFPRVRLEVVLLDRSVNPVTEGFDLAIGAYWISFGGVTEIPLCRLDRLVCASPDYLANSQEIRHPRDLINHACLSFIPTGNSWVFEGRQGQITIEVTPRLSSNDAQILVDAAAAGRGIALISYYMARDLIRTGALVPILQEFPVPPLWIKAVAPDRRVNVSAVQALISRFQEALKHLPVR